MKWFWPRYFGQKGAPSLDDIRRRIRRAGVVAIDTETSIRPEHLQGKLTDRRKRTLCTDYRTARIVGVSVCWREDEPPPELETIDPQDPAAPPREGPWYPSIYFPLRHKLYPDPHPTVPHLIRELVEGEQLKVLHQAPFDRSMFYWSEGWTLAEPYVDTMLCAWIHDENVQRSLKGLAELWLGFAPLEMKELDSLLFDAIPPWIGYTYACQDAYLTLRLYEWITWQWREQGQDGFFKLLWELEQPTQETFLQMSQTGIPIDIDLVRKYRHVLEETVTAIEERVEALTGRRVNLRSPVQVKALLKSLGASVRNTQRLTMIELAESHPDERVRTVAGLILVHKKYDKIKGTYLRNLETWLWDDYRIRPEYYQWFVEEGGEGKRAGTVTGRSSCKRPPLHSTPRAPVGLPGVPPPEEGGWEPVPDYGITPTPLMREVGCVNVKRCMRAPDGWVFIAADASQIEPRVSTAITGEPLLLRLYREGANVYRFLAGRYLGVSPEEVKKGTGIYQAFKRCFLSKNYLAGVDTVHRALIQDGVRDITREEVQQILSFIDQTFPCTHAYQFHVKEMLIRDKYVTSLTGRRRRFPDYHPDDHEMLRQARNYLIQNVAFDIMKRAMNRLRQEFARRGLSARLCGQIHDEVIVLLPENEAPAVAELVREAMTEPVPEFPNQVPLDTEVTWGRTLGDMRPYEGREALPVEPTPDPIQAYKELLVETLPCRACDHPAFAACGYHKVGWAGILKPGLDLVYLGANPGIEEMNQLRPFIGPSGGLLVRVAAELGLPHPDLGGEAALCNVLWCGAADTEGLAWKHVQNCLPRLDRMLAVLRPRVVIAFGVIAAMGALRQNIGSVGSVLGWHTRSAETRVYVAWHPSHLLRSPGKLEAWKAGLAEVAAYLKGVTCGATVA